MQRRRVRSKNWREGENRRSRMNEPTPHLDDARFQSARTGSLIEQDLVEALADQAPEPLIALSPGGTIRYWNRSAGALFGHGSEEMIGRGFLEVVPIDVREQAAGALAQAVSAGAATFRASFRRDDGSKHLVEAGLKCIRDEHGEARFVAVGVKDLSELLRLQEVQATEARFRGLLEAAPDAMIILRADRSIALVNNQLERLFGYPREELLGQPIEVLVPDRFREGHVKHRDRYFGEPRTRPMGAGLELFGRRKDGSEFPVEISLSPMQMEGGMLVTAAIRDITERKLAEAERRQAEDAVRKLNKELEAFSYSVSHDLRAPLRAIDGFSQVLLEDYAPKLDAQGRDSLGRIRQASQRMAQLIDDLLALSRINRAELRQAPVDLSDLARAVAADLRERDPARRISWSIADGLQTQGDPHLLQIALANLLENAWKFTRQQPEATIAVGAQERDGGRVFFVQDNGVGFDMAYASKLFSPFQRLHPQAEFEGTGIGLVTVQRIVHRHGGRIWAESAVGNGTAFFFTLGEAT